MVCMSMCVIAALTTYIMPLILKTQINFTIFIYELFRLLVSDMLNVFDSHVSLISYSLDRQLNLIVLCCNKCNENAPIKHSRG